MLKLLSRFAGLLHSGHQTTPPPTQACVWEKIQNTLWESKDSEAIAIKLISQGWEYVGVHSSFAKVFISPCQCYALRLGFRKEDKYDYHAFNAITHQHNSYFPQVYQHVSCLNRGYSFTLMEALYPTKRSQRSKVDQMCYILPKEGKPTWNHDMSMHLDKDFAQAMIICYETMKTHKLLSDFKHGNVMRRSNNELVIIDPFV